jgi:hypothetical protein
MSNSAWRRASSYLAVIALLLALTACGEIKKSKADALDSALYDFASAMRWNDLDKAYDFVDPKTKVEHPLSDIDRSRYTQVEIANYEVLTRMDGPGIVDQQIRLSLVNRNTQVGRSMVYHEHWRYDEEHKVWLLTTGLPDISPQQ